MSAALFNTAIAMGIIIEIVRFRLTRVQQIDITEHLVVCSGFDDLEDIHGSLESVDTWLRKVVVVQCSEPMEEQLGVFHRVNYVNCVIDSYKHAHVHKGNDYGIERHMR